MPKDNGSLKSTLTALLYSSPVGRKLELHAAFLE